MVALLLSASIFALGVMVGKNLSPPPRPNAPAQALLDRLDAQGRRRIDVVNDSLTFQDELTKKLAPAPAPKAAKQAAPTIPLPAAPVAAPPQAPSFAGPPPTAVAAALIDAGGAKSLVLSELTEKDSGVEVAVASKLPMIRVPAAPKSFFTVQRVKATQSSGEADKFAKKLRGQGYQSSTGCWRREVEAEGQRLVSGAGRKVRDTRAQADHYLLDFKRETHLEAFVTAAGHYVPEVEIGSSLSALGIERARSRDRVRSPRAGLASNSHAGVKLAGGDCWLSRMKNGSRVARINSLQNRMAKTVRRSARPPAEEPRPPPDGLGSDAFAQWLVGPRRESGVAGSAVPDSR